MAKITPRSQDTTVTVKTQPKTNDLVAGKWWLKQSKAEVCNTLLGTVAFLKEQNQFKLRQSALYARLYGNMPLFGWLGTNLTKMSTGNTLPIDRPTMSVITSCVDTLHSRLIQARPSPMFLSDGGDYKQRTLAKQMNTFIQGEFYQTKAYQQGALALRDAMVLGTGILKILEDEKNKVCLERKIFTELLVDPNDSLFGDPRQMYEIKLIDRDVLADMFPKYRSQIQKAQQAYPDASGEYSKTVSDQVMVAEGWHLPSGPNAGDGRHTIACSEGIIFDEEYTKERFPFVFLHYSQRMVGFFGAGIPEQLMGTQVEINKLLMTISASINLVGVPRVFIEEGSKVVKAHLNNNVGSIVTYRGVKPSYEVAPCVPAELYAQLERLVQYAYQQCGVSALAATSRKPQGLNSGAALREYDDIQTDRFADLQKRYEQFFIDLAYQVIDKAKDIALRDGKYETIYPDKNGLKQVNLPEAKRLEDPFVIQCFDVSSLPKDPAGRLEHVTEMMQAGIVSPQEGRRLLGYPDIEQEDRLAIAAEERILQILDAMVEDGKYTQPDPFMDLQMASQKTVQYINLYSQLKLEDEKMQLLRNFFSQITAMKSQAMAAQMPQAAPQPQASPLAPPQSDLIQNVPGPQPQQ